MAFTFLKGKEKVYTPRYYNLIKAMLFLYKEGRNAVRHYVIFVHTCTRIRTCTLYSTVHRMKTVPKTANTGICCALYCTMYIHSLAKFESL